MNSTPPSAPAGSDSAGHGASGHRPALRSVLPAEVIERFRTWLLGHCQASAQEVRETVNVNVVLQHVLDAYGQNYLGRGRELLRFFNVKSENLVAPPDFPNQKSSQQHPTFPVHWVKKVLYFPPSVLLSALNKYLRERSQKLPITQMDLQAQLKPHPFFVPGPLKQRFAEQHTSIYCWGLDLDYLPGFGRLPVPDEAVFANWEAHYAAWATYREKRMSVATVWTQADEASIPAPTETWEDPRLGPLYNIVEDVEQAKKEQGSKS